MPINLGTRSLFARCLVLSFVLSAVTACSGHSPVAPTLPRDVAAPTPPVPASGNWTEIFGDEFDADGAPSGVRWNYEIGGQRNNEEQAYTARPQNARIEGGVLIIEARRETFNRHKYTSASLTTLGRFEFTYGRVEVRAKLPGGIGTWPAIWTLGTTASWPRGGEIDIMENVGFDPTTIYGSIHTDGFNGGSALTVPDPSQDFHVYSMEWSAERIVVSVDDRPYWTYQNPGTGEAAWPFDKPQYLLLNLAIGGTWGGQQGIDDSIFPRQFLVDSVRIYQQR